MLDDQNLQRKVGRLLGVDDERALAIKTAQDWQTENQYEDAPEDTLRHMLLGGLTTPEGLEPRKALANALMNVRETGLSNVPIIGRFVEGPSVEDRIDINNNNFGTALARKMMDDGTYTPEAFIETAKRYVTWMAQGERGIPIDGLDPQLSTANAPQTTPSPKK